MIWVGRRGHEAKHLLDAVQRATGDKGPAWADTVDHEAEEVTRPLRRAADSFRPVLEKGLAKFAGLVSPSAAVSPMRTPVVATGARAAARTNRFSGVATENSLKPPGPALSRSVVKPTRSISSSMRTTT